MKVFYREVVPDKKVVPGAVLIYQTFGAEAANYHCHVHGLFSEGAFDREGHFYPVTGVPYKRMEEYFRLSVLGMLKKEGLISDDLIQNLLSWRHSGFNIHAEGKAVANDDSGRERVANHLGDLGAICNDVAFTFFYYQFGRLKEIMLRINKKLFGHRYLMDCVRPGGVSVDLSLQRAEAILSEVKEIASEFERLVKIYDDSPSLADRLYDTGVLHGCPPSPWAILKEILQAVES